MQSWKIGDSKELFGFWHQLDDKELADLYQLVLPPIKVNSLLYINFLDTPLTIENLNPQNLNKVQHGCLKNLDLSNNGLDEHPEIDNMSSDQVQDYINSVPLLNHKAQKYDENTHVRVRLLSNENIPINLEDLPETTVDDDQNTNKFLKAKTYTSGITQMGEKAKISLKETF